MNHLLSSLVQQLGGKQALSAGDQRTGGNPLMPASSGGGEGGGDPFFQTYVSVLGANVSGGEDAESGSTGSANGGGTAKGGEKVLPGMALAAPVTLENAQEGKASSNTDNEASQSSVQESGKVGEISGETAESGEAREGGESSDGEKSTEAKEEETTQNADGENESEGESTGNEKKSADKKDQRTEKQGTSAENRPTLTSGGETERSAESGTTNGTGGAAEGGEKSSATAAAESENSGETAKDASAQTSGKKEGETSARPTNASGRPTENGSSEPSRESRPTQALEENGQKLSAEEKSNDAGEKKGADTGSKKSSGSETGSRKHSAAASAQKSGGSAATASQAAAASQSAPAGSAEGTQNSGRAVSGTNSSGSESADSANRASAGSSGNGSSAGAQGRNASRGSSSTSGSAQAANTQADSRGGTANPGRTSGGKTAPAAPRQGEVPDTGGGETRKRQPMEQAKGLGGERSSSGKQDQNRPNRSSGGNSTIRQSGPDRAPAGSRQDGKTMELDPSGSRSRAVEQKNPKESGFSGMATGATGTNDTGRPEQQRAVGFQPLNRVTEAEREFSPSMKSTQGELNRSSLEMMDTEMSGEREFGGSDDSEGGEMRKLEALNTSQLRNSSAVRQKLSMHIARAVRQEMVQSRGGSEAQWQHHRFVLDDGQSVNVSFRHAEGAIQLQLGSGSAEMNKLLQQHLGEIREHLQQELDVDVNLEFQDFEGKQFEGEQSDRPGDLTRTSTPLEGESEGEPSPSSAPKQVRYMGFNTNEWTA